MAGWVTAPSGAKVWQDDSGLVHVKDAGGMVTAIKPTEAARYLGDKDSGYSPASADELNAAHEAAEKAAEEAKSSTFGAAARHVAIGAAGALLAPGKLVSGLGSAALGVDDPLRNISGRQVVTDASALADEFTGGNAEVKGRETREQILADEAIHPVASGVGEAAGNVAGSLATGGGVGALASKGAAALGLAGRAAQIGTAVIGSTLEGAGLGADAASEQAWVKNQPVTAEQTLAGIGLGGLFGAAAGGTFATAGPALAKFLGRGAKAEATGLEGAALRAEGEIGSAEAAAVPGKATMAVDEAVAPAALESVPEPMINRARNWKSDLSDELTVDAIARGNKPSMKRLGNGDSPSREVVRSTGRTLQEMGVTGNSESAMYDQVVPAKEIAGKNIGAIVDSLDAKAGADAAPRIENVLSEVKSRITRMRSSAVVGSEEALANSLENEMAPTMRRAAARVAWNKEAKVAMRGADSLLAAAESTSSSGNAAYVAKLRESVAAAKAAIEGGYADATHLTPVSDALQALTRAPSSSIRDSASQLLEHVGEVAERADAAPRMGFRDMHTLRSAIDDAAYDTIGGSKKLKEELKGIRGLVEGEITRAIGTHDPETLASYALEKERYRAASWAEKTLKERLGVRDQANRWASPSDYMTGAAVFAHSGNPLAAGAAMLGNKVLRERGLPIAASIFRKLGADSVNVGAAPAGALRTARAVQTMVARSESHIGDSIGRFLGTGAASGSGLARGGGRATTAAALRSSDLTTAQNAYRDHAREVQTVASVPDVAASRLQSITGQTLPVVAPGLHTAMAATAMKAAGYLSQNLPCAPSDPDSITPQLDSPPPASRADLHTYANRVEGVEDPLSLLDDLNKGHVPPEKVEAVKAVWPELFARMRQTTFDHLAQRTEKQGPVPYHERQLLDLALDGGGALEPSLRPDSLAVMQQAQQWQAQQLKQKAPRPAAGGSPKLGNMLQTSTDRIAAR